MFRGGEPAFGRKRWPGSRLQRPNDVVPILHAEELIDLGQLGTQLLRITLAQAAHDEQPFDFTRLFGGGGPEDHVDRLLFGVADEAAGVDDHDFGIGAVAVVRDRIACGCELGHQVLRIDRVFRAPEGDDV